MERKTYVLNNSGFYEEIHYKVNYPKGPLCSLYAVNAALGGDFLTPEYIDELIDKYVETHFPNSSMEDKIEQKKKMGYGKKDADEEEHGYQVDPYLNTLLNEIGFHLRRVTTMYGKPNHAYVILGFYREDLEDYFGKYFKTNEIPDLAGHAVAMKDGLFIDTNKFGAVIYQKIPKDFVVVQCYIMEKIGEGYVGDPKLAPDNQNIEGALRWSKFRTLHSYLTAMRVSGYRQQNYTFIPWVDPIYLKEQQDLDPQFPKNALHKLQDEMLFYAPNQFTPSYKKSDPVPSFVKRHNAQQQKHMETISSVFAPENEQWLQDFLEGKYAEDEEKVAKNDVPSPYESQDEENVVVKKSVTSLHSLPKEKRLLNTLEEDDNELGKKKQKKY